jgi:type IV pilus assembly protein PilA
MRDRRSFVRRLIRLRVLSSALVVAIAFIAPATPAQNGPAAKQTGSGSAEENKQQATAGQATKIQQTPWAKDLEKYPGLQEELAKLVIKLRDGVELPKPRTESRLLPLLPESTVGYAAVPNYGSTMEQVLKIFRGQLLQSALLRDWWEHGEMTKDGEKILERIEKFKQFEDYLGEELVLSAALEGKGGKFVVVAETKKPGLKQFLEQMTADDSAKSFAGIQVVEPEDLITIKPKTPQDLLVLVREDYMVGATDLATLRKFDSQLEAKIHAFPETAFGKRVAKEYTGGVTILTAGDMHTILQQASPELRSSDTFQQSGFADMQYLLWDRKNVGGKPVSQMELSFTGPRHGAAAWIGKPTTLRSLEFVSPDATVVGSLVLASPERVLEVAEELARTAHSKMFDALPGFEQMLGLSLKDDLLAQLGGEITLEVSNLLPAKPTWTALLSVKNADRLQSTLNKLIAATHVQSSQTEENGVIYSSVVMPRQKDGTEVVYTFVDGYLLIGSSKEALAESVGLRENGKGLGKNEALLAAVPEGRGLQASGFFYENPALMAKLQLQQIAPGLAQSLTAASERSTPLTMWLYGEDTAIREASVSPSVDAAGVLLVAALAIPNLMRSRIAANEASAVGSVRTINTAQVTYAAMYPAKGFAKSLSVVGPDPRGVTFTSPEHAAIVEGVLACAGEDWCTKLGYRFRVMASVCNGGPCKEYTVTATPVSSGTGNRSFCSASDEVIHYKMGQPLVEPVSVDECKRWMVLR